MRSRFAAIQKERNAIAREYALANVPRNPPFSAPAQRRRDSVRHDHAPDGLSSRAAQTALPFPASDSFVNSRRTADLIDLPPGKCSWKSPMALQMFQHRIFCKTTAGPSTVQDFLRHFRIRNPAQPRPTFLARLLDTRPNRQPR